MPVLAAIALVVAALYAITRGAGGGRMNPPATKAEFFARLRPVALEVERETGIKADLGMVQAAHESAYGKSGLTQSANNLFGFTAELPTYWRREGRPYVSMPTTEWKDGAPYKTTRPFRAYASWGESYRDWARLMGTSNYSVALSHARAGNLKGFAEALQAAGYATDPSYAAKLAGVARAAGVA